MFERFSDGARRVMVLSQEEARQLGHNFIDTEHLLLGLIEQGEGVAARALAALGIGAGAVRDEVVKRYGPAGQASSGSPPFTPQAKKVLELSLREALQLGHPYIGTEHMLLAITREGDCVAGRILVTLGANLPEVRHQVIEMIAGSPAPGPAAASQPRREERPSGPRCPACRSALEGNVGYRTLAVNPVDQPGAAAPVEVRFVYCLRCGVTLAHRPADELSASGSGTVTVAPAHPAGVASVTERSIAEGVTDDGVRWTLTAGGSEDNYSTTLRTEDASGVIHSGGMGGPKLWGPELLNVYTGRDPERGPLAVVARCHPSVEHLSVVQGDGTEVEMVACGEADGLRFGVLLVAPDTQLREVVGANHDREVLARFVLRWRPVS